MKTIVTKEMIGEAISNWAKKQEEFEDVCNQCGRNNTIHHEYVKDCKEGTCKENYPDEDCFKDYHE